MNVLREHITVIPIPVAQIMRLVIAVHVTQDLPEMDSTAVVSGKRESLCKPRGAYMTNNSIIGSTSIRNTIGTVCMYTITAIFNNIFVIQKDHCLCHTHHSHKVELINDIHSMTRLWKYTYVAVRTRCAKTVYSTWLAIKL